jgi:hypothetical protein
LVIVVVVVIIVVVVLIRILIRTHVFWHIARVNAEVIFIIIVL